MTLLVYECAVVLAIDLVSVLPHTVHFLVCVPSAAQVAALVVDQSPNVCVVSLGIVSV